MTGLSVADLREWLGFWAVPIGVACSYTVIMLVLAWRLRGGARFAALTALLVPAAWLTYVYGSFHVLCKANEQVKYHERGLRVDGLVAGGRHAEAALRVDIRTEDGYLFYEHEKDTQLHRTDPSGASEKVQQRRSRYAFEVAEPRARNPLISVHESRFVVRDLTNAKAIAEGRDILLGGWPLRRKHLERYGAPYLACGPGIERGGWREGWTSDRRRGTYEAFVKRDREFVRTALIPARSSAGREPSLEKSVRTQGPLSFQNTLWQLVAAVLVNDAYHPPGVFFYGDVPGGGAYELLSNDDWKDDPDLRGAKYWALVLANPKQGDRASTMARMLVIQGNERVIVKAVPLENRNETLDTTTLQFRRGLHADAAEAVAAAARPPQPPARQPGSEVRSRYGLDESAQRILDQFAAAPGYLSGNRDRVPGEKSVVRVYFYRVDRGLMAQVFSYSKHASGGNFLLWVDVAETDGAVSVSTASLAERFPRELSPSLAAQYALEAHDLIAVALGSR